MKPAVKRLLKERRREIKTQLKLHRAKIRALKQQNKKKSPWRRRILILLILLLLLLLGPCTSDEPPPRRGTGPAPVAVVEPVPEPPVVKKPFKKRVKRRVRPKYEGPKKTKNRWLDAFRLQVAGRSVRLAACFEGVDKPGAVRWVAAVDPVTGVTSDHTLEPVTRSAALGRKQRACVVGVLSKPPYKLSPEKDEQGPQRVGLVLEF